VGFFKLHLQGRVETPSTLVGLLALSLSTMGWLHGIGASLFLLLLFFLFPYFWILAYFLYYHSNLQEKIMTAEEFAQMPNCNLVESIHNKWLQASGNKGGDLYVATMDDYIRVFLQIVAYHQFLKGGAGGDGPSKEELKLRYAQRRA
jgi:hypothetical protein